METDPGREEMAHIIANRLMTKGSIDEIVGDLIEKSGGPDHIVVSDGVKGNWTMQHPLTERFTGELFECPMVERAQQLASQGAFDAGKHRLYVGEYGIVMWEEVGAS